MPVGDKVQRLRLTEAFISTPVVIFHCIYLYQDQMEVSTYSVSSVCIIVNHLNAGIFC